MVRPASPRLAITREQTGLSTLQKNALRQVFGRREFTAEDVARLDYRQVQRLPKIGKKGLEQICAWLQQQGYELSNPPMPENEVGSGAALRLSQRLENAARLLQRHGYRVTPPDMQ